MKPSRNINALIEILAALRNPETGCPWDIEQDFASIAPYTIEEAYEVADAIERNDFDDLCEELGDLLLQVVFHARMAEERELFNFGDVVHAITGKLIRRHPHIFENTVDLSAAEVLVLWNEIKNQEKQLKHSREENAGFKSLLDDIPSNMPSLVRGEKLQQKAAQVGFDWNNTKDVLAKICEELNEVQEAIRIGNQESIKDEIGDLLFATTNLARHLGVSAETAMNSTNKKFSRRFKHIEQHIGRNGQSLEEASLDDMEALWNEAKKFE